MSETTTATLLTAGLTPAEAAGLVRAQRVPLPAVARDDLSREAAFRLRADGEEDGPGDGLTLDGVGAVFNEITTVDSWEGTFEETINPGAFKKSLRETRPKIQFDHGTHPVIGSMPIGQFEDGYPREEDDGLHVRARLHDNWMTIPLRDSLASKSIDGMSFRFSIVNETWHLPEGRTATNPGKKITDPEEILQRIFFPSEDGLLRRVLKELKMREVGPVVWPQYEGTSVSIRSRVTIDLADPSSLRDRETQETLARALFLTEHVRAEEDAGPQSSDSPDDHPAPAERTDEVRDIGEAEGPEVSDQSPGEHPTDSTDDPERGARVAALLARFDVVMTGSASTRDLIDHFHTTGEDTSDG